MTTALFVSDIHDEEQKHRQMVDFAKGCDFIATAGDDFDRELEGHQYEANILIAKLQHEHRKTSKVKPETTKALEALLHEASDLPEDEQKTALDGFLQQHPEVSEEYERIGAAVKQGFLSYFIQRAQAIDEAYRTTGVPVVGTPGNHDPLPAIEQVSSVRYLLGDTFKLNGLTIAGLPATGEWVPGPMQFCPEFFGHLMHYRPVEEGTDAEISGLAKKLVDEKGPIDVFITHKAYDPEIQEWDRFYQPGGPLADFGVDAGAAAVHKRHKPKLNVFGHYHMDKPKVKRSSDGKTWHLYVGPNAAVKVTLDKNEPVNFESCYYR